MRFFTALVAIVCLHLASAIDTTNQALKDAANTYCAKTTVDLGITMNQRDLIHQIIGPTNIVHQIIFDDSCGSIQACFDTYKSQWIQQALRLGVPHIFMILSLILYLFLASCACCRCCRQCPIWCCCKEKEFPAYFSGPALTFIWISMGFVFIAVIIDTAFSAVSTVDMRSGSLAILCRTTSLASAVLNGVNWTASADLQAMNLSDKSFIGMEPLYNQMQTLSDVLAVDGSVVNTISSTVNDTVQLENAVNRLTEYLELTNEMLGNADTISPGSGEYSCVLCTACCSGGVDSYVSQIRNVISESLAKNLNEVRSQVNKTLAGSGLTDTREAVRSGADTMRQVTDTVEEQLGQRVLDNRDLIDLVLLVIWIVTLVLTASALVPVFWLIMSAVYGVCKSYKVSYSDPDDKPRNPCCVSTGWCLSLMYAFLIFLVAGIFIIVGYVQASVCDEIADFDLFIDKALDKFGSGSMSSGTSTVLVDACLKSNGTGDFLSGVNAAAFNASYYLNQVEDLKDLISTTFNSVPAVPSLANSAEFRQMIDSMDEYGGLYMMSPRRIVELQADSAFMNAMTLTDAQKHLGFGSSATCNAKTYNLTRTALGAMVQGTLTAAGYTLPNDLTAVSVAGVNDYIAQLNADAITGVTYTGTCDTLSVTKNSFDPYSSLLYWKAQPSSKTDFKCDTITETEDPDTHVVTFNRVTGTCNSLTAFTTYVGYLKGRLEQAAATIDTQADSTKTVMQARIISIITDQILPPVIKVLSESDCSPLRNGWNALFNSFCSDFTYGVVGLGITFSVYGGLALISVFIMFFIWRNLKDNISLWRDLVKEREERLGSAVRSHVVPAVPGPAAVQVIPDSGPSRASRKR